MIVYNKVKMLKFSLYCLSRGSVNRRALIESFIEKTILACLCYAFGLERFLLLQLKRYFQIFPDISLLTECITDSFVKLCL